MITPTFFTSLNIFFFSIYETLIILPFCYFYVISTFLIHFKIDSYELHISHQNEAKIKISHLEMLSCKVSDTSIFFLYEYILLLQSKHVISFAYYIFFWFQLVLATALAQVLKLFLVFYYCGVTFKNSWRLYFVLTVLP